MKHFQDFHKALAFAKAQRGTLKRVDGGFTVTLNGPVIAEPSATVTVPKKVRQMPRFTQQRAYIEAQRMADAAAQTRAEEHRTDAAGKPYTVRVKSGYGVAFATPGAFGKAWAVTPKPVNHRSVKFTSHAQVQVIPEPEPEMPIGVLRTQLEELKNLRKRAPEGRSMPCEHLDSQILETKRELLRLLSSDLASAALAGDDSAADALMRTMVNLQTSDARRILNQELRIREESPETTALPADEYKALCKEGKIRCFSHKHAASEAIGRITGRDMRTGELHRSRKWYSYTPPSVCSVVKHKTRGDWWCLENQVLRWDSKHYEANEIYRASSCQFGVTTEQLSTPASVPVWSVEVLMHGTSISTNMPALTGERAESKVKNTLIAGNPNAQFEIGEVREADADAMSDITVDELEAGLMDWADDEVASELANAE